MEITLKFNFKDNEEYDHRVELLNCLPLVREWLIRSYSSVAEAARDLRHTDEQADELINECADFDALAEKVAEGCLPMDLEEALAEFIQCDEDIQIEAYEDWKSSHLPTSR